MFKIKKQQVDSLAPAEFYCSLTHQVMEDPVVNMYGYLFERQAIEAWIKGGNSFCPCTGNDMTLVDLMSARKLRERILQWKNANPANNNEEGCILRIKMAMRQAAVCR